MHLQLVETLHVDVAQIAATIALSVVVVDHVGVEAGGATGEVQHLQLAHGGQIVERLVHRAQRDARHQLACRGKKRFRGGVGHVAVQHPEEQLSLWGDLEPTLPKGGAEFGR